MEQFQRESAEESKKAAGKQHSNEVNLLKMIESRIMEIIQIEDECKRKLPKLYNQRLPRFMRRRAACHDTRRVPKKWRPANLLATGYGSKSRKSLMKYRRRVKFQKHKRSLRKHQRANYKNPDKCLLHKWFAKRFKIDNNDEMKYVPLHNNVKNQRNLARQARYGCSYLCMAHLLPIQLVFSRASSRIDRLDGILESLNDLTKQIAGFTFRAKALKSGNYQLAVHLYKPETKLKEYLCLALVSLSVAKEEHKETTLTVWVPQVHHELVYNHFSRLISQQLEDCSKVSLIKIAANHCTRVRLVGPEAREETLRIAADPEIHKKAIEDVDLRLSYSLGLSIGRYIEETDASFVYYKTNPQVVDIVFRGKEGRMLWYKLIKNKAHLVGGYRDLSRVLSDNRFQVKPDCSPSA